MRRPRPSVFIRLATSVPHPGQDALAAVVVTLMLIPQSLAYAMLAGLTAQAGLYASMLPLVAYAALGSSKTLAVGPVAIISLMTAEALGGLGLTDMGSYAAAAMVLALLSGAMLMLMGLLRLGEAANFISHPVIGGFLAASALLIGVGQVRHIAGIEAKGSGFVDQIATLAFNVDSTHGATLAIGIAVLLVLMGAKFASPRLQDRPAWVRAMPRFAPILGVGASILVTLAFDLDARGVAVVGDVPRILPTLAVPTLDPDLVSQLLLPALAIALVGFVETVSVAQTLAAKRRETVDPDRELLGLGAANIAAGVSGGFPVTGGLSRSAVAFEAGARTRLTGVLTAFGIALVAAFLTPALKALPIATLAATIIVAVASLIDLGIVRRAARYAKSDLTTLLVTFAATLIVGVVEGLAAGILLSLALHLHRSSRPHMAIVGQVPGTEHFRNVRRHDVNLCPDTLSLRVDESLFFANARGLEATVLALVADNPGLRCFILVCPAINSIDMSALESLERINAALKDAGVTLHMSEVKGPVMDRLNRVGFADDLSGQVFLTQLDAVRHCRQDARAATPASASKAATATP